MTALHSAQALDRIIGEMREAKKPLKAISNAIEQLAESGESGETATPHYAFLLEKALMVLERHENDVSDVKRSLKGELEKARGG